jgi:site-specific DNA-methyltransferase (adenine-specific)
MSNLYQRTYNPDILECLANLSSDEVFTPPDVANKMLDLLPQELFSNPKTTFLDPACKSGVFLREIAKRLITGLEHAITDIGKRIEHIYHNQLFGIAITELTSLMSRRTLYYTKYPQTKFSISEFDNPEGNIIYKNLEHTWEGNNCIYCGASRSGFDRDDGLEKHAYNFIHTEKSEEIFNMKFDVIIGNPPYQLSDGGGVGSSAIPIYQKFVEQAIKLNPKYIVMITPSRWFTGGRGLDEFRSLMLKESRIKEIHNYSEASDCFPGVEIKGGVNYFLWDKDHHGDTLVCDYEGGEIISSETRPLLIEGMDIFIRDSRALSILGKVRLLEEEPFSDIVSANDPFGFDRRVEGSYKRIKPEFKLEPFKNSIRFFYNGWRSNGIGYIHRDAVTKRAKVIDKFKLLIPKAWGTGKPDGSTLKPILASPGSCCTETYLLVGPFDTLKEMIHARTYIRTKFFHFMVYLVKNTQNTMKKCYQFVPIQDFSKPWTDEELYAKYNLSEDEISFIESMIRPMDLEE